MAVDAESSQSGPPRVRVWDVTAPGDPCALVCGLAGRSFTEREWSQYLPDDSYRAVCP